jgi:hypothetical protein
MRRGALLTFVSLLLTTLHLAACSKPGIADLYDRQVLSNDPPAAYSDRDWATVLRENVKEGLVDYEHLQSHREPLDRYLAYLAATGPQSNPGGFPNLNDELAYHVNAYNACVLAAVLHEELPISMHLPEGRRIDYDYRFLIDRGVQSPGGLRARIHELGLLNPRLEFCLCDAAMGSPPLAAEPYQPDEFDRQVRETARRAMDNPAMVRIDHATTRLEVSMLIAEHREDFLEFYRRQTGSRNATLLAALLYMASDQRREQLNTAIGYEDGLIPFDRSLNIWHRSSPPAELPPGESTEPPAEDSEPLPPEA